MTSIDRSLIGRAAPGESTGVRVGPAIRVSLALDPRLLNVLRAGDLLEAVRDEAAAALSRLSEVLGVPGTVQLDVGERPSEPTSAGQWLKLEVNGVVCPYPDEALSFVHAYASEEVASPEMGAAALLERLKTACLERFQRRREEVVEFFSFACADIVSRQPGCLMGPEGLGRYLANLGHAQNIGARFGNKPDALLSLFRGVLNLGISIADTSVVSRVLSTPTGDSASAIFEDLVEALRPDVVEVRLQKDYLMRLRDIEPDAEETLLPFLREALCKELGAIYPDLRIVVDDELKDQCFSVKINHLAGTPLLGLARNEIFVNDTKKRLVDDPKEPLRRDEVRSALNPETWQPGAITAAEHKAKLEASGGTTWTPWGYLILCVASALRRGAGTYVHRPLVRYRLDRLAAVYPAVVEQVTRCRTLDELTYLVRALAAEQISTRDLRGICERLLDLDYDASDGCRYAILGERVGLLDLGRGNPQRPEERLTCLLRFLRAGLTRQLSHKFARGTGTVVVYLLDEAFERMLQAASRTGLTDAQREQALSALRAELTFLPPTAQRPSVLTMAGVRPVLKDITRIALPHLSVISYEDLDASMNIQPVARIALAAPA